jgi:hypothetical protein
LKTTLDCLPCLLGQALNGARLAAPDDPEAHKAAVLSWAGAFPEMDLHRSPPDLAGDLYGMLTEATGSADPFAEQKSEANRRALEAWPRLSEMVAGADDPLEAALMLSVIGNYADHGAPHQADFMAAVEDECGQSLAGPELDALRETARAGGMVLIIGDNCGEIVFDKLMVRELQELGARVTYAVRGRPVLNDATLDDAREVGMDELCEVVSSGVDSPGTVLSRCSREFRRLLGEAGAVVSKGQGNYEGLVGELPGVFFAFKVKCAAVARHVGREQGSTVFIRP